MSVYSGFATRNLENAYNMRIGQVIQMLQGAVLGFLKHGE